MDTILIYSFICLEEVFQDIFITFGIWGIYNNYFMSKIILSAKVHTCPVGTMKAWEHRGGQCIAQSRDANEVAYLGECTESRPKQILGYR